MVMSVWWFETFFIFTPIPGKNDPIWLAHIFQMGWFNHQLDIVKFPQIPRLCFHSSLGELRRNIFSMWGDLGGFHHEKGAPVVASSPQKKTCPHERWRLRSLWRLRAPRRRRSERALGRRRVAGVAKGAAAAAAAGSEARWGDLKTWHFLGGAHF